MNIKSQRIKLLLLPALLLASIQVLAETLYVNDQLIITLRTGQSNQHQILKTLPSGTALELLERNDDYSRVRTPDGIEGWVLTQYLTSTPVARQQLASSQRQLAATQQENARLQAELAKLQEQEALLRKEHAALTAQFESANQDVERLSRVAEQPLKLENENQRLKKEFLELENEYRLLRQEHQILTDSSDREWFMTGAAVIILGVLIGLIAPKFRSRKKTGW